MSTGLLSQRRMPGLTGSSGTAPRASAVWIALQRAMQGLQARREATPCSGRPEWTSDRAADIRTAIAACGACPIYRECRAVGLAYKEPGVWGGTYRPAKGEQP